jgi:HEAT repeat protein
MDRPRRSPTPPWTRSRRLGFLALLLAIAQGGGPRVAAGEGKEGLKAKDVETRLATVEAIRKEGGDGAEALLLTALQDADWEVVENAAKALAERGGPASSKPLVDLALQAPARRTRLAAASALARLDPESAAKHLARDLRGDEGVRAAEALAVLAREGGERGHAEVRKVAEKALKAKDAPVRAAAITALAAWPPGERAQRLAKSFDDPDLTVPAAALTAALAMPDVAFFPVLLERWRLPAVEDGIERRIAANLDAILAASNDEKVRAGLVADVFGVLAGAKDPVVAGRVARFIGDAAAAPPAPPTAAGSPEPPAPPPPRIEPEVALRGIEPALAHRGEGARALAVRALGRIGTPVAIARATALAADDPAPRVRAQALRTVVTARGVADDATRRLVEKRLSQDADAVVREQAAVLLGASGKDGAPFPAPVAALEKALADPEWSVAVVAAVSLGKTRAPEAVEPLRRLTDPKTTKDWRRRAAAVAGLGRVRAKAAVPALIAALSDKDPSVKRTAYESLRRFTTRNVPPSREEWQAWFDHASPTLEFPNAEKAAREAKKGPFAETPAGAWEGLDVVVLQSRGDHAERLLDDQGVGYRLTRAAAGPASELHPSALFLSNCTGDLEAADVERLQWFVKVGGTIVGSCRALENTVMLVAPGAMRRLPTNAAVIDHVVVEPCAPQSPLLDGVLSASPQPVFVLWGSQVIDVLEPERVDVLADAPACAAHWGGGALLARFESGHGTVLQCANHFDHPGMEHVIGLKTPADRMAYALDHMGLSFADLRRFEKTKVWEDPTETLKQVKDLSVFRLLTNLVREERREDWR